MSLLYRKASRVTLSTSAAIAAVLTQTPVANAAETYVQPLIEVRAEAHDNFALSPNPQNQSDEFGGKVDVGAVFGWVSPTGETSIRPRLRFQEYSTDEKVTNFEAFFDLRSEYQTERSNFLLVGRFDKRDSTTAEFSDAGFDDLDPEDPTTPETGSRTFDETRERYELRPSYQYRVSERASVGFGVIYQAVSYSDESPNERADYDYLQGEVAFSWATGPRTDLGLFANVSQFETRDGLNNTDAVGVGISLVQRWTESSGTEVRIYAEQNDITYGEVPTNKDDDSVGGEITYFSKGEMSDWRVVAGRSFTPTGNGEKSATDQARVEYKRRISEISQLKTAFRYIDGTSLGELGFANDRKYMRLDLEYRRFLTPTWYWGVGYTYRWQDRESALRSADDNQVYISFGYAGLGKQSK